jgi:cytidine deaminase
MSLLLEDKKLIEKTRKMLEKVKGDGKNKIGSVGSGIITKKGNFYFGVSVDLYCTLGGCGERSAILNMISSGESEIKSIVAVTKTDIYPPCGVCREMMLQIDKKNLDADVIISNSKKIKLNDLLPNKWQEVSGDW